MILKTTIKQRFQDNFIQKWLSDINNVSRENSTHLKYIRKPYLLRPKRGFRTVVCKLRTYNN